MVLKSGLALALATCLILVACGTGNSSSNGPVDLVVWTNTDTIGVKWFNTEIAVFEKAHPNIHVKVLQESQSNDYAKYTTAITGHKAPDLMLTYSYPIVPTWAKAGFLKPMDSYLDQLGFKSSSFFPYVNKLDKFNGKTWGLVQAYDDALFTWNKTMFANAGLNPNDPPRTLSQLMADAQKLTIVKNGTLVQAGFVPFIGEGNLSVWDILEGGRMYSNGKFNMNSPTMIKAMQLWLDYDQLLGGANAWQSLYAKAVGTSDLVVGNPNGNTAFTNPGNPFYTGQVAMALVGDWYPVFYYPQYAKNLDWGEAPPPVADGVKYGTNAAIGTDMFVLPVDSPHPLQATQLALFLDEPGPALLWDKLESNMPPNAATIYNPNFLKDVPAEQPSVVAAKNNLLVGYPTTPAWSPLDAHYIGPMEQQLALQRISASAAGSQLQSDAKSVVASTG